MLKLILIATINIFTFVNLSYANNCITSCISVCFTQEEPCEIKIIDKILSAKKEIFIQAYAFTSKSIAESLIEAHKKSINVQILFDKHMNDGKRSQIPFLIKNGINCIAEKKEKGIAHNKVMIIDNELVIGGSYNYTYSANNFNSENVTFTYSKNIAKLYKKNWHKSKK